MSDIKTILSRMVVLGMLVFSIMSFIIITQNNNQVDITDRITNNTLINDSYGDLEISLNQQSESENSLNALEEVPPQEYIGDLSIASMVSSTRTARSIVIGLWNIYIKLPMVVFGVSPIIASAITTILLIFIAIGIWAIWKGAIS